MATTTHGSPCSTSTTSPPPPSYVVCLPTLLLFLFSIFPPFYPLLRPITITYSKEQQTRYQLALLYSSSRNGGGYSVFDAACCRCTNKRTLFLVLHEDSLSVCCIKNSTKCVYWRFGVCNIILFMCCCVREPISLSWAVKWSPFPPTTTPWFDLFSIISTGALATTDTTLVVVVVITLAPTNNKMRKTMISPSTFQFFFCYFAEKLSSGCAIHGRRGNLFYKLTLKF